MRLDDICERFLITSYSINEDGSIDVEGDVDCRYENLFQLPIKFGKVSGNFYCSHNRLTSLEGSPTKVGGRFHCNNNQLTSLEGSPKYVGSNFYCQDNLLTDFEYGPDWIGGELRSSPLENYIKLLSVQIKDRIIIKDKLFSKQELLLIELNKILEPYEYHIIYDHGFSPPFIIKDVFNNIISRSTEKDLQKHIVELIA